MVTLLAIAWALQSANLSPANRFSAFTSPDPSIPRYSHTTQGTSEPHVHNARGTKESKRRRDRRRYQHKMSPQKLDAQLGHAVGSALPVTKFYPWSRLATRSPQASTSAPSSPSDVMTLEASRRSRLPPIPPELLSLDFSQFDLDAFPPLEAARRNAAYSTHATVAAAVDQLPYWCPPLPSLTVADVWRDCEPLFSNLSALPKPLEEPGVGLKVSDEVNDTQMQLYNPFNDQLWRKQSKFFPPKSAGTWATLKATVKLPPPVIVNGCKLHESDSGVVELEALPKSRGSFVPDGDSVEHLAAVPDRQISRLTPRPQTFPDEFASDLLRLFCSPDRQHNWDDAESYRMLTVDDRIEDRASSSVLRQRDPTEIDGREVPYTHANSLVGCSNALGSRRPTSFYKYAVLRYGGSLDNSVNAPSDLSDSATAAGLNELLMDTDILNPRSATPSLEAAAKQPLPPSPSRIVRSGIPPFSNDLRYLLDEDPTSSTIQQQRQPAVSELALINSDRSESHNGPHNAAAAGTAEQKAAHAHFISEASLFALPSPLASSAALEQDDGIVDVATFLNLGHARQCWCGRGRGRCSEFDDDDVEVVTHGEVGPLVSIDGDAEARGQAGSGAGAKAKTVAEAEAEATSLSCPLVEDEDWLLCCTSPTEESDDDEGGDDAEWEWGVNTPPETGVQGFAKEDYSGDEDHLRMACGGLDEVWTW